MRSVGCLVAALALALPVAQAQNKCVDARGKVTYQQDPCPGTAALKPLPPAPPRNPPRPDADRGELFVSAMCEGWRKELAETRAKVAQEKDARYRAELERKIAEFEREIREPCSTAR
jgi:hypothetical protein